MFAAQHEEFNINVFSGKSNFSGWCVGKARSGSVKREKAKALSFMLLISKKPKRRKK
jgi:hypothetical protein